MIFFTDHLPIAKGRQASITVEESGEHYFNQVIKINSIRTNGHPVLLDVMNCEGHT